MYGVQYYSGQRYQTSFVWIVFSGGLNRPFEWRWLSIFIPFIFFFRFPFDNNKTRASWPPFFRALKPRYKKWHWVKLCSLHFKPECYEDDDKKVLKPRAIPTEIIHRSVPPGECFMSLTYTAAVILHVPYPYPCCTTLFSFY